MQNIQNNNKFLKEFRDLCDYYEIAYHEEKIEFNSIDENKFSYFLDCIKKGLPEAFVVFGGEIAINIAKLFNYLIPNKKIKSLNDFIKNLNLSVEFPLKLFCVLNEFTLGSENNFPGVLKIQYQNQINRYIFNANSMPAYIFSDEELFKDFDLQKININVYAMLVRAMEQYLYKNNFEWTKNYILSNIQTLIDVINTKETNSSNKIDNILWTNLCINNGMSNLLNIGDWKIHILAYELSDYFNIELNDAILLIAIKYFEIRNQIDENFRQLLKNFCFQLLGNNAEHCVINFLNETINKLNLNEKYQKLNEGPFFNEKEKLNIIKNNAINKILLMDNSMNKNQLNELISILFKLN